MKSNFEKMIGSEFLLREYIEKVNMSAYERRKMNKRLELIKSIYKK